jgi:hypothetical protein
MIGVLPLVVVLVGQRMGLRPAVSAVSAAPAAT